MPSASSNLPSRICFLASRLSLPIFSLGFCWCVCVFAREVLGVHKASAITNTTAVIGSPSLTSKALFPLLTFISISPRSLCTTRADRVRKINVNVYRISETLHLFFRRHILPLGRRRLRTLDHLELSQAREQMLIEYRVTAIADVAKEVARFFVADSAHRSIRGQEIPALVG